MSHHVTLIKNNEASVCFRSAISLCKLGGIVGLFQMQNLPLFTTGKGVSGGVKLFGKHLV